MGQVNRRKVLLGGLAAVTATAASAALPSWANARTTAAAPAIHDPFQLGVASGDPLPDSVVLWTRLAPAPLNADGYGGMPDATYAVDWEIANDAAFSSVVQSGSASAVRASAHSVHIEPAGLQPAREYFYRFKTSGYISPVGRTRTAPAAGAAVNQLKYCFTSCQHWEEGYYHAYKGVVADDPDLVLFLGDYIYEKKSGRAAAERNPRSLAVADDATTLAIYRARHGQHKTDADLQAAHAIAPWIVVFDDHEVSQLTTVYHPLNSGKVRSCPAPRRTGWRTAHSDARVIAGASSRPDSVAAPHWRRVKATGRRRCHLVATWQSSRTASQRLD